MNSFGQLSIRMGRKTWNKNPFQKDAYRPLFTIQGERGLCPGGVSLQGVRRSLSGGLCPGGSLSRGSLSGKPPMDRQTPVKLLPCPKLRLRALTRQFHSYMEKAVTNRSIQYRV